MDFKLVVNMDNAAFDRGDGRELARILREIANKVQDGKTDGRAMDVNGNKVGEWEVSE